MALVGHKVSEHVANVQRQVAPHVSRAGGYLAAATTPESQKRLHAPAAPVECGEQLAATHLLAVHGSRNHDALGLAQGLEPHTPAVVEVTGDHPNRLPRGSRDRSRPDLGRYVTDEKDRDLMIGPPGRQDGLGEIRSGGHFGSPLGTVLRPHRSCVSRDGSAADGGRRNRGLTSFADAVENGFCLRSVRTAAVKQILVDSQCPDNRRGRVSWFSAEPLSSRFAKRRLTLLANEAERDVILRNC